ncbi:MAG: hypothetical protein WCH65_07695 [bacterium]
MLSRKALFHKELGQEDVYECLKTLGYSVEYTAEATQAAVQSNTK